MLYDIKLNDILSNGKHWMNKRCYFVLFYPALYKLKFFQFVTFEEHHLLPIILLHNTVQSWVFSHRNKSTFAFRNIKIRVQREKCVNYSTFTFVFLNSWLNYVGRHWYQIWSFNKKKQLYESTREKIAVSTIWVIRAMHKVHVRGDRKRRARLSQLARYISTIVGAIDNREIQHRRISITWLVHTYARVCVCAFMRDAYSQLYNSNYYY